ncbi:cupin domain-containing protein [Mesorhizobium sp. B4-1-4]|uniref:cupin domain-containing protein n=1 Tax=Mesorhizobium sp. B4-1-4 TaxID=2589888 RepID=UPI00112B6DC6|nr:cupin domain-containing protein [Mesorhizobium sp. B4-1-4]UCI30803.1 cupin domain-containing protein [Mesorhizobium sp. B4-1-4]
MLHSPIDQTYELSDVEVETVRRAALVSALPFVPDKRIYSSDELHQYGVVREAYTSEEVKGLGFLDGVVTSFDPSAGKARTFLRVETPFSRGISKWQLPVDMKEVRIHEISFPPNSFVAPHVHHENEPGDPGGSLRIVTVGSINYRNNVFGPGDWFYIPNGVAYSFTTDPNCTTRAMYLYRFFAAREGNRFSHPSAISALSAIEPME